MNIFRKTKLLNRFNLTTGIGWKPLSTRILSKSCETVRQ